MGEKAGKIHDRSLSFIILFGKVYLRPDLKKQAMRLGQLARKLDLSPTEIINFLTERNIPTSEGSNTRLNEEHVIMVCRKFDPADLKQVISGNVRKEETENLPVTEAS